MKACGRLTGKVLLESGGFSNNLNYVRAWEKPHRDDRVSITEDQLTTNCV